MLNKIRAALVQILLPLSLLQVLEELRSLGLKAEVLVQASRPEGGKYSSVSWKVLPGGGLEFSSWCGDEDILVPWAREFRPTGETVPLVGEGALEKLQGKIKTLEAALASEKSEVIYLGKEREGLQGKVDELRSEARRLEGLLAKREEFECSVEKG